MQEHNLSSQIELFDQSNITIGSNNPNPKPNKQTAFTTGWEVLQKPGIEQRFFVENIFPEGTICLISGPSDTGKSILARQIAVAAALNKDNVMGFQLNLRHGKAIYVSTEDGESTWQEKLKKYQLTESDMRLTTNLRLSFDIEQFDVTVLENALKLEPADVVVIDVFTDLYPADLNNPIQVRKFFAPYKALAARYGCTFLFVHHLNKKGESSAPSKLNVSGSQAIESAMRCVIELRADPTDDNMRHLVVTKCNILPPHEKKLSYRLELKPTLEFNYTDERAPIDSLGNSRPGLSVEQRARAIEVCKNFSVRQASVELAKEGIRIGKSALAEMYRLQKEKGDGQEKVELAA